MPWPAPEGKGSAPALPNGAARPFGDAVRLANRSPVCFALTMPFSVSPGHPNATIAHHTVELCVEKCWRVILTCEGGHRGGWSTAELAERFPPGATLGAIAQRLRCATCGTASGCLELRQDRGATGVRDLERHEQSLAQRAPASGSTSTLRPPKA